MKRLLLLMLLCSPALAQVQPQITGAGAPTNPCVNGGQQYLDTTGHVLYNCSVPGQNWVNIGLGNLTGGGSSGLSGMTAGQIPVAATATTVTSSAPLQGTDTNILTAGTVSGTAAPLCTDAQGGATTTGCPSGGVSASGSLVNNNLLLGAGASSVKDYGSAILAPANGGGPVFTTSGVSEYLLPFGENTAAVTSTAGGTVGVTNRVLCKQVTINGSVTFTKMMVNVTTTSSTNHEYIGIYNAAGTSLLVQGTFTLGAGTGNLSTTVSSATLNSGQYRFCRSADQTTSVLSAVGSNTTVAGMINTNALREGIAANSTSGGVMPASTGAISAAAESGWIVLLEP